MVRIAQVSGIVALAALFVAPWVFPMLPQLLYGVLGPVGAFIVSARVPIILVGLALCFSGGDGSLARFIGRPVRVVGWVWDRAVGLFTPSPISRRIGRITPAGVDRWLAERFAGHRNLMLAGDRRAFALRSWPESRYQTNYRTIPPDVRRPVIWDGRVIGGRAVTWLAWRHVTPEVVSGLLRASARIGLRAGAILALVCIVPVIWRIVQTIGALSQSGSYPAWASGVSIKPILGWYALVGVQLVFGAAISLFFAVLAAALFTPAAMFFAFARGLRAWWEDASSALATPTRDSGVIYKHRADIRQAEYQAYTRQADNAAGRLARQPLIKVGVATGVFRARGDMEAPALGQLVALDGETIRQHTIALGETGSGKTRLVIRPMFERIMEAKWGPNHRIGAYVTDGKGTLWQSLEGCAPLDYRKDVIVIGTGAGQFGVDLLKGMSPLEVSTTLKAVSGQVMGASSDSFWPEMASLLILHAATVAQVLDMDPTLEDPATTAPTWRDKRPWSLVGVARIACDWRTTEESIARLRELKDQGKALPGDLYTALMTDDLISAVSWLKGEWFAMANETKSGVVANVNVVLGKLSGAGELRRRFCTGRHAGDLVEVSHALNGGILMVGVGETEWGVVGKVVSVWLKTRLYIEARKKLERDPDSCRNTSCALLMDECQMLMTTGQDSDATFWNIARETGVFAIAATQSLAALKQALGAEATDNLVNLFCTKIVLKTSEPGTLDYCVKLSGETLRGYVTDADFYETQGQREIEVPDAGAAPDLSERVSIGRILPTLTTTIDTISTRPLAKLDFRFTTRSNIFQPETASEARSSQQAAFWRQEDREREMNGMGLQWRPKIGTDDLLLGSGMAFAIVQRAGADRMDLIDLVD